MFGDSERRGGKVNVDFELPNQNKSIQNTFISNFSYEEKPDYPERLKDSKSTE